MYNSKKRKQYTVEFKIKIVEKYILEGMAPCTLRDVYDLSSSQLIWKWLKLYKDGKLKLSNTISVSHRGTLKAQTIESNGKPYLELYIKPETVMYNGKEYIVKDK